MIRAPKREEQMAEVVEDHDEHDGKELCGQDRQSNDLDEQREQTTR
jgi:hypothetical protein